MPINWSETFDRVVQSALPLNVRAATLENEQLYVGDRETWHFNTSSAWRLRDGESLVAGWTWPEASERVWDLCFTRLIAVTVQSSRTPVDPVLVFDNGWSLEVFGEHYLDPWTLHLPTAILVGDGGL